jgi:O-antigen ligase
MQSPPEPAQPTPESHLQRVPRPAPWARYCAGFWGLVLFMPVGLTYLAFFALALALVAGGHQSVRWQQLRAHGLFVPLLVLTAWTLFVLALQPVIYPETPSNLWHGLRIVLTFAMALALTREEATWALRGFLIAAACSVLVIVAGPALGLPMDSPLRNLMQYSGNKSISNALLLAVLAGSAVIVALACTGRDRLAALAVALVLLGLIVFALPSRSALLIALLSMPAVALHQWRNQWRRLLLALGFMALVAVLLVALVPAMQSRLALGLAELQQASTGDVIWGSWNMRVQMIRHTADMVLEKPWMGWGIGAWNDQWRQRAPAALVNLNMPHNDFLWMGAQAGLAGALAWLAVLLAACRIGWRRQDVAGRLAFVAALAMLAAALVNSATRDAAIGLCLPWIAAVFLRLADGPARPDDPGGATARAILWR